MKILLTGRNGQLGWELERALAPLGEVHACDRQSLDLADPDKIVAVVRELKPALIVAGLRAQAPDVDHGFHVLRIAGQRTGDRQALLLAAREDARGAALLDPQARRR